MAARSCSRRRTTSASPGCSRSTRSSRRRAGCSPAAAGTIGWRSTTPRGGGAKVEDTFSAFSPKVERDLPALGAERPASRQSTSTARTRRPSSRRARPSRLTPADVDAELQPEDIDNNEGGLKGSAGRRPRLARGDLLLHDGRRVVLTTRQGPFFIPTNAGELSYRGVETGISVAITQGSAYVNASFYRNRFGDFVIEIRGRRRGVHRQSSADLARLRRQLGRDVHAGAVGGRDVRRQEYGRRGDGPREYVHDRSLHPGRCRGDVASWATAYDARGHNLFDEADYWNADGFTADPGRPRQVSFTISVGLK